VLGALAKAKPLEKAGERDCVTAPVLAAQMAPALWQLQRPRQSNLGFWHRACGETPQIRSKAGLLRRTSTSRASGVVRTAEFYSLPSARSVRRWPKIHLWRQNVIGDESEKLLLPQIAAGADTCRGWDPDGVRAETQTGSRNGSNSAVKQVCPGRLSLSSSLPPWARMISRARLKPSPSPSGDSLA
jgi:hypothetical protein